MEASGEPVFGPTSFRDYLAEHDIDASNRTPQYISVDSISDLKTTLREANVMVLRMGSAPDGTGTQFLLVDTPTGISEFFLHDATVFDQQPTASFESPVEYEKLLSFQLLPRLSETSLVNLALASGVLGTALDLDTTGSLMPPATGRSTFTFDVRPHSSVSEVFTHRTGQVEIDTLFAERRGGEMTLFVIEAKAGTNHSTLAKHKLVYPTLALADEIPPAIDIVPIYMRCDQDGDIMTFQIAECDFPDPRESIPGIDELEADQSRTIRLELDSSGNELVG